MTLLTLLGGKGRPVGYIQLSNSLGSNSSATLSNGLGTNSLQTIANSLGTTSYLTIINGIAAVVYYFLMYSTLGSSSSTTVDTPLTYSPQYQTIVNELSAMLNDYITLLYDISPARVTDTTTIRNDLASTDYIYDYFALKYDIGGMQYDSPPVGYTEYKDEFGNVKDIADAPTGTVYAMDDDGSTLLGFEPAITDIKVEIKGMDYTSKVKSIEIDISEDNIFNQCSVSFEDLSLFKVLDPEITFAGMTKEDNRIKITINDAVEYNFLLEYRRASETFESKSFEVWGRSRTAILAEPYSDTIDYTLSENKTLSEVIDEIITLSGKSISVTFDYPDSKESIEDFTVLAPAISYENTFPIDIIEDLVNAYGAIVRTDVDGNLVIRDKYRVRPQDMESSPETLSVNRVNHIISTDWGFQAKDNYSRVIVMNNPPSTGISFTIEEENTPILNGGAAFNGDYYNNDVILRVYYNNRDFLFNGEDTPQIKYTATVTDGYTEFISVNTSPYYNVRAISGDDAEFVQIVNGVANVQYPILAITSVEFIPDDGTCVYYKATELYGTEIKFYSSWGGSEDSEDTELWGCGLAKISYTTCYDRWRVYNTNEEKVLFCIRLSEELHNMLQVTLARATTIKDAEPIEDERLYSEKEARHRGLTFLDDNYWNWVKRTIEVPYLYNKVSNTAVEDGDLININDPEMGCEGIYKITQVRIVGELPKITMQLSVDQLIEPEE